MKTDDFKTDVIFRKEKDDSILAVFPYNISDMVGNCVCYSHLGQHSGTSWAYITLDTKPTKENEYKDLKTELESLGYNLNVIKRRNYDKYLKSYYEVRRG